MTARHVRWAAAVAILAAWAPAGAATAAPVTVTGWPAVEAALGGGTLAWATTATNRLRGFSYWSTEVSTVRLGRTGPSGAATSPVAVRTQAGPFGPVGLTAGADGSVVLVARGRGFAPPVVWCCDTRGLEVVMHSDGRAGAARALAAAVDGPRVRMVLAAASGATLVGEDPRRLTDEQEALAGALPRVEAAFPGTPVEGLVAASGPLLAWVDAADPAAVRTGTVTDAGLAEGTPLPTGARVRGVWVEAPSTVVVASGTSAVTLTRHDLAGGTRRVVWRGAGVPRVAVGGGVVAVASGRAVSAGRGALRPLRTAAGEVAAVATDGRRVAAFERIVRRGGKRATVMRLLAVTG
ncbi:MAG: hypothetical protein AB1416_07950 [Actinomycetota bacterium]